MKTPQIKPQMRTHLSITGGLFLVVAVWALSIADMGWGEVLPMLVLLGSGAALVIYAWNADGPTGGSGAGDRNGTRHRTGDWD